ncbi:MAG: DUF4345 domain-containing protein [Actinobacteria bacterium]|nr:DUF4345 domain-containing protein [Actinomycetota bacterium]
MDERIRRLVFVTGAVATVLGALGVVRGIDDVRGRPGESRPEDAPWLASVDSEFRFFAAWYATVGAWSVREAATADPGRDVRWVGAAWLASATGRALSIRSHGRPHGLYLVLMGVELGLGMLLSARGKGSSFPARRIPLSLRSLSLSRPRSGRPGTVEGS